MIRSDLLRILVWLRMVHFPQIQAARAMTQSRMSTLRYSEDGSRPKR
jgi:hypothetical protein